MARLLQNEILLFQKLISWYLFHPVRGLPKGEDRLEKFDQDESKISNAHLCMPILMAGPKWNCGREYLAPPWGVWQERVESHWAHRSTGKSWVKIKSIQPRTVRAGVWGLWHVYLDVKASFRNSIFILLEDRFLNWSFLKSYTSQSASHIASFLLK